MGNSSRRQLKKSRYKDDAYPHQKTRLGNNDWTVYVVPKTSPRLSDRWGRSWGITDFEHKTIYNTNHLSEQNFKWTFTHEMLHAFMDELGYHELLLRKIGKKKNEEMIDGLAKVLYPLIKKSVFKVRNYQMKGRERT